MNHHDELAQVIARRTDLVARAVSRVNTGQVVAAAGRVCESSGYCGCACRACLGGRHKCGHRKGCHKTCRSL